MERYTYRNEILIKRKLNKNGNSDGEINSQHIIFRIVLCVYVPYATKCLDKKLVT